MKLGAARPPPPSEAPLHLLVASGLLVGAFWFFVPKYRSWEERFHDVKVGMNEAQVVEAIGIDAGDYSTGAVVMWDAGLNWRHRRAEAKVWSCDDTEICVWFDTNGLVSDTCIARGYLIEPKDESIVQRLRRWLRL